VVRKALEQLVVDPKLGTDFDHQTFHQLFGNEQRGPRELVIRFAFGPRVFTHCSTYNLSSIRGERNGEQRVFGGEDVFYTVVERCIHVHSAQRVLRIIDDPTHIAPEYACHRCVQYTGARVDEIVQGRADALQQRLAHPVVEPLLQEGV